MCTESDIGCGRKEEPITNTFREQSILNMIWHFEIIKRHLDPARDNDFQYVSTRKKAVKGMISLLENFE